MTNEEKQLLFIDLCARLPYDVIVQSVGENKILGLVDLSNPDLFLPKPYLRPLSSMTSEEWVEFCDCSIKDERSWALTTNRQKLVPVTHREDFLNSHHFDYRGLIPMGLALEVKEGMYKTE